MWHPISRARSIDPPAPATPRLVRVLLAQQPNISLEYRGDGMWPALRHRQRFEATKLDGTALRVGQVVVAELDGACDIARVVSVAAAERGGLLQITGDAEPGAILEVPSSRVLALAHLPEKKVSRLERRLNRVNRDWTELRQDRLDRQSEVTATVREKYRTQAVAYAANEARLDKNLLRWIEEQLPPGGKILVIGCGTGSECIRLAQAGYRVEGLDFANEMLEAAGRRAREAGLEIEFHQGDVCAFAAPAKSYDSILFTYEVYSFLPREEDRIALLRRMTDWLRPDGKILLSARLVRNTYQRAVLTAQWASRFGRDAWGDSHTRWFREDGSINYSFVHLFTPRQLQREVRAAGFAIGGQRGGHWLIEPRQGRQIER